VTSELLTAEPGAPSHEALRFLASYGTMGTEP